MRKTNKLKTKNLDPAHDDVGQRIIKIIGFPPTLKKTLIHAIGDKIEHLEGK